jgi:hypothetical protein
MRALAGIAVITLLTSCNTFRVDGAPTFGRVHDVTVADIEAAIAAYRASPRDRKAPVGQIEVVGPNEIRIYVGEAGSGYTRILPQNSV